MEKVLKFAVRFFIYFCVILPILSNVFGGSWFGGIIGFVLAVVIMVSCHNCGTQVTLKNGQGKCPGCGSIFA